MAAFSDRYPGSRLAKVFSGILALLMFAVVSISAVSGFLLYQILRPPRNPATFDLSVMMGHPTTFSCPLADGSMREGWLFPGLRGAPVVVVCHGYLAQRADVLTLVTALQDHQFNVFLFDFSGHGTSPGQTTLGYRETAELRAAIQGLATREDLDSRRVGLWGVDMGGYAALEAALVDRRVGALAVDDAYDDPRTMLQIQIKKSGLTVLPEVPRVSDLAFRMLNYSFRNEPPISTRIWRTEGMPKLFIQANDQPALAAETLKLFVKAPDPKGMLRDRLSYRDMSDDDRKSYESQIVNFFLQNIPPTSAH
jgi:pimeloyl-ACP methyl ester carboxylesterase